MKVKIKGIYRHDTPGHTEQGLKEYDLDFGHTSTLSRGAVIIQAAKFLKEQDPSFDSIKTHHVEFYDDPIPVIEPPVIEPPVIEPPVIEPPVIEPPVIEPPVIEPPVIEPQGEIDVKSEPEQSSADGAGSGAELFE